ncbi:toxin-activating lysine-acyltransferase [Aquicoccus sp. SU-CL01552]|uniref:toxin-activating lysine-acyltransferase n=1 Tax=Aquicoccus sp. SU-CL01552 TaxID=3127656 RepID=UPI00310947E1
MTSETGQPPPSKPDPVAGKTVAEILGEITWLMTQDPEGKEMRISEIERLVMPAILQKRFHIKYAQVPDVRQPGVTALQPVSVEIKSAADTARSGHVSTAPDQPSGVPHRLIFSLPNVVSTPD